jgi:hypothetical protein
MTKEDRKKTAVYLQILCARIANRQWPDEKKEFVRKKIQHWMSLANQMETE